MVITTATTYTRGV